MPTVQDSYALRMGNGYEGQIADTTRCDADTFVADESAGIGFGLAVKKGTNAGECSLGAVAGGDPFHATDFLGVTIRDRTREPDANDKYADNSHVAVLFRGDIWVKVPSAVAVGDDVSVNTANGQFSTAAGSANQAVIPNARWMTAAAANGLAVLRLGGAPQV